MESAAVQRGGTSPPHESREPARRDTVLLLANGPEWDDVAQLAREHGYLVLEARSIFEALAHLRDAAPDLVVIPGEAQGLELLERLRGGESSAVSAIVLTRAGDMAMLVEAFERGADDVVACDADTKELGARIRARLERRALPRAEMLRDPVTGAFTEESLALMVQLEIERVGRVERPASFAYLAFHELPVVESELGQRARDAILAQIVDIVEADGRRLDVIGFSQGHLALLLPEAPPLGAGLVTGRVALPVGRAAQSAADRASEAGPRVPPRLARGVSLDLPPDLPDPRLLDAARVAAGQLVRPGLRRDDALHVQRRARSGVDGMGLSAPALRKRGRWFVLYGLVSQLFYVELKNVIARTAHLKEGMRERRWKVTPRSTRLVTPVRRSRS